MHRLTAYFRSRRAPGKPRKQAVFSDGGNDSERLVPRIWGRAREPVRLFADGKQLSRSRIGPKGWVDIVSAEIQHGDMLRVTDLNGHAYHRIA
jgi:hypothetical protein